MSPVTLTLTFPAPVGLNADSSRDFLFFMDYKSSCSRAHMASGGRAHMASGGRGHMADSLEEQLLSYSENAENEGEEVEYLEEEELQVHTSTLHLCFPKSHLLSPDLCCCGYTSM